MILTVRLDPETAELIMRLRRRRSDLRVSEPTRPYEAVKRLVGSVNSGGLHLAKRTGEQFTVLLVERRRARRPR